MSYGNKKQPKGVFNFHNSTKKIRELSDGNKKLETELWLAKQTFFLELRWVPPFLRIELWKLRIEWWELPIQTASRPLELAVRAITLMTGLLTITVRVVSQVTGSPTSIDKMSSSIIEPPTLVAGSRFWLLVAGEVSPTIELPTSIISKASPAPNC